jgi:hypothetical protein
MNAYSIPIGRQVADQVSFADVTTIQDVAGGAGDGSAGLDSRL